MGHVTTDATMCSILTAADLFVIPSLEEAFGQTCVEAMACGTPIVGFDTGGIPDMVRPGFTGLLAPRGDTTALAAALDALLGDEATRHRMGVNCRLVVVTGHHRTSQVRAPLAQPPSAYQVRVIAFCKAPHSNMIRRGFAESNDSAGGRSQGAHEWLVLGAR